MFKVKQNTAVNMVAKIKFAVKKLKGEAPAGGATKSNPAPPTPN